MNIFLEVGNLNGLFALIAAIMVGPSILLTIIGFVVYRKNKKTAKVLFILAVVYLIISFGICGSMLA